jgi:hypothetical protein
MYRYEELRPTVLTDAGQRRFLRVRDFVHKTLATAGAVRMQEAMSAATGGDSWEQIACVDRMVELGEIREIPQTSVCGQHRVFVKATQ